MKRVFWRFVCVLLLLAAQHGALAHQIQHIQDYLPAQSQQHDDGKQSSQSALCDFHAAFTEILGSINPALPVLWLAANTTERGIRPPSFDFPATLIIPASRGPPVLL